MRTFLLATAAMLVLAGPADAQFSDPWKPAKDYLNEQVRQAEELGRAERQRALDAAGNTSAIIDAINRQPYPYAPPSSAPAAPEPAQDNYMEGYRDGHNDSFFGDGYTPHR